MVNRPKSWAHAVVLAGSVLATDCHGAGVRPSVTANYDPRTGKLYQLTYDSNSNGKPDVISHMDGSEVVRVELDLDEDGLVDRWEHYGVDGNLEKVGISRSNDGIEDEWVFEGAPGSVGRIEISTRPDGRVSRTQFYEDGVLVRAHEDTDGDGRIDKWETYRGGVLRDAAFDPEGIGRPTQRLTYDWDGGLERVVKDGAATMKGSHR